MKITSQKFNNVITIAFSLQISLYHIKRYMTNYIKLSKLSILQYSPVIRLSVINDIVEHYHEHKSKGKYIH